MIKPTVLLLLVLGISGYLYLDRLTKHHMSLKKSSGYHTFFKSTAYGLLLFVASSFLYIVCVFLGDFFGVQKDLGDWILSDALFIDAGEYHHTYASLIDISVLTLASAILFPKVGYLYIRLTKEYRISDKLLKCDWLRKLSDWFLKEYGLFAYHRETQLQKVFFADPENPEFSTIIRMSREQGLPILFTLSDNKVYVGYPFEFVGRPLVNDILILPLVSGFRNDNRGLKITARYIEVIQALQAREKEEFKKELLKDGYSKESLETLLSDPSNSLYGEDDPYGLGVDLDLWARFAICLPFREIIHTHLHDLTLEAEFKKHTSE
ncbi:hypothetical protein K2100_004230 [Vibrio parahaemolyticus]|nr:hypothetical protein [Vibrio parahaemolyticus]